MSTYNLYAGFIMDEIEILIVISSILGILLTISELLATSNCHSNSIWECMCQSCHGEEL